MPRTAAGGRPYPPGSAPLNVVRRVRHDLDLDFPLAVGEIKVKMELRFKWVFAKSAEMRVQKVCPANGFPHICDFCKTSRGVQNLLHLWRFCRNHK